MMQSIPERDEAYRPGQTALLLVDMQRAWLEPGADPKHPGSPENYFYRETAQQVIPNQQKLLRAARANGVEAHLSGGDDWRCRSGAAIQHRISRSRRDCEPVFGDGGRRADTVVQGWFDPLFVESLHAVRKTEMMTLAALSPTEICERYRTLY